jgi:TRAP-type C4-dicarboxylate transport system substrate-binding protein
MIDAVIASPLAAAFYQWFGVVPNMTDMKIAPIFGAVIISVKSWDRVPSDMRPHLLQAAQRASLSMAGSSMRTEGDAVNIMKTYGLSVHSPSSVAKEEWNAMMSRFHRLGALFDREAYEKVRLYLEEYRNNNAN